MISNFQDKYAFLSTFFDKQIEYNGLIYKNAESAFQAQKTDSEQLRKKFTRLLPSEAIRRGRKVLLRSDWESIKEDIMYEINKIKFSDDVLKQKLLDTGNEQLINENNSNDTIWGICQGNGDNKLGKILMKIREEFQNGNETGDKPKKSKKSKSNESEPEEERQLSDI